MKIVIAPDSFKGSLSSEEAAEAMRAAVQEVMPHAQSVILPISDGGEGAVQVLSTALPGRMQKSALPAPMGSRLRPLIFSRTPALASSSWPKPPGLR